MSEADLLDVRAFPQPHEYRLIELPLVAHHSLHQVLDRAIERLEKRDPLMDLFAQVRERMEENSARPTSRSR